MNVLFFEPIAAWSPHFETCLEIMQHYLDDGASITFIGCDESIPICDANPDHDLIICLHCISRRKQGLKMLAPASAIKYLSLDKLFIDSNILSCPPKWNFSTIDQVKEYKIDNYDIGMGAVSSFATINRVMELDLFGMRDQLIKFLNASHNIYYAIKNYLLQNGPDSVYIFNGRFSILRGVLRICQQYSINCYIHERGANIHKYSITQNALPHNIPNKLSEIRQYWDEAPTDRRLSIAEQFYYDRAGGKQQSWFSFAANQEKGLLPEGWNPLKKNIVIFNSSDDEFSSIGDEWKNPLYQSQLEGLERIITDLSVNSGVHVYLRMHPNLAGIHNKSIGYLSHVTADNFTLISPESKISTYALIKAADTVISFGSTVGIEAVFWGKPSILAGKCFYRDLGSVYLPTTHEEVIRLALSDLEPKDRTGALMYGYYLNTFGREYKYFEATEIFSGRFKGQAILPSRAVTYITGIIDMLGIKQILPFIIRLSKSRGYQLFKEIAG